MADEFKSLEDVAEYLRKCRVRKLQGDYLSFEAKPGAVDLSQQVIYFFKNNESKYGLGATDRFRWVAFSPNNFARLNTYLESEELQPIVPEEAHLCIEMEHKFGRSSNAWGR